MRDKWKVVAERADLSAFDCENIGEAIGPALADDWRLEVPEPLLRALKRCFVDSLVPVPAAEVEALRELSQGLPFADLLLSCAAMTASEGAVGSEALAQATEAALFERALQGVRQTEEHYQRRVGSDRAQNVRSRMEGGIECAEISVVARQLLNSGATAQIRRIPKHDELDDGAPLP